MIHESIIEDAAKLRLEAAPLAKLVPALALDLNWPSFGALDFFLRPLRGKSEFSLEELQLIRRASAYLIGLAHDCWETFPEKLRCEAVPNKERGGALELRARSAAFAKPQEQVVLRVEEALRAHLMSVPEQFMFFPGIVRRYSQESNIVSPFALGVFCGLAPWGEGPWANTSPESHSACLSAADALLAASSAEYYRRVFSYESIGGEQGLYRANLILPPLLHEEPFPAMRGVASFLKYTAARNLEAEVLQTLALNLSSSPDELISSVGVVCATALSTGVPHRRLIATCEAKGSSLPALRPSLMLARKSLERPFDWVEELKTGNVESAQALLYTEHTLGFTPLVFYPEALLRGSVNIELCEALAWSNLERAIALATDDPDNIFQLAFLMLFAGDENSAVTLLKSAPNRGTFDAIQRAELLGLILLSLNRHKEAVAQFGQLLGNADRANGAHITRIANMIALCLLREGEAKEARDYCLDAKNKGLFSTTTLLNLASAYEQTGEGHEVSQLLQELCPIAGNDYRVISRIAAIIDEDLAPDW